MRIEPPEVHDRFNVVGPDVGVKLAEGGATENADASVPVIVQFRPTVAKDPDPEPPLGVTRICPEPVVPIAVTPVRAIVSPKFGEYPRVGGNTLPSDCALADVEPIKAAEIIKAVGTHCSRREVRAGRCIGRLLEGVPLFGK